MLPTLSTVQWICLTALLLAGVGVEAWMVSQNYVSSAVLSTTVGTIVAAVVGIVFHSAGAQAALATPTPTPTPTPAPASKPAPVAGS